MNTTCFIGVFQFLGTYIATQNPLALVGFVNGVVYHGGCKWWKWPDIVWNCGAIVYEFMYAPPAAPRSCALIACIVYLLNKQSDIVHVMGVQTIVNIPLIVIGDISHNVLTIPPCILLGAVIAGIINGTSRLATGDATSPSVKEDCIPKSSTQGTRFPRRRPRYAYYISTADRAYYGKGCSQASRSFLGISTTRLSYQRKGHGRCRNW